MLGVEMVMQKVRQAARMSPAEVAAKTSACGRGDARDIRSIGVADGLIDYLRDALCRELCRSPSALGRASGRTIYASPASDSTRFLGFLS